MFTGFSRELLGYLDGLEKNNNKEWFASHRGEYTSLLVEPTKQFVTALGSALRSLSPTVTAEPRFSGSIRRLNKDLRFSPTQPPYRTSVFLRFWDGRSRQNSPAFYLRIGAQTAWVGAGLHDFNPDQLRRYRDAVVGPPGADLVKAVNRSLGVAGTELFGRHYKRVPRGFDPHDRRANFLLHNRLFVGRSMPTPVALFEKTGPRHMAGQFRKYAPIVGWLKSHVAFG